MKHTCRYILRPNNFNHETKEFTPAIYCDKKVSYSMIDDGEGNKNRLYDAFCDKHEKEIFDDYIE